MRDSRVDAEERTMVMIEGRVSAARSVEQSAYDERGQCDERSCQRQGYNQDTFQLNWLMTYSYHTSSISHLTAISTTRFCTTFIEYSIKYVSPSIKEICYRMKSLNPCATTAPRTDRRLYFSYLPLHARLDPFHQPPPPRSSPTCSPQTHQASFSPHH